MPQLPSTHAPSFDTPQAAEERPPIGPLGRLAGVAFRHRWRVVLAWVAALAIAIGLASVANGEFSADYSAPGSDSAQAQTLLEEQFPSQSGDTIDVVVRSRRTRHGTSGAAGCLSAARRAQRPTARCRGG